MKARYLAIAASLAAAIGCGGTSYNVGPGGPAPMDMASMGGEMVGATPGGAQDIGYAREQIAAGAVPGADAFLTEGLLSEHDLPTVGGACDDLLCVRPAVVKAEHLASGNEDVWVHLGMSTNVPMAEFERPPLDIVVAIDKSSSMSVNMEETNRAVVKLIESLGPEDRLAVFAFDTEIHPVMEFGPVRDKQAVAQRVLALGANGSWDVHKAVDHAYDIVSRHASADRTQRVVMLSCGYPSVSPDRSDAFSQRVVAGAAKDIGMTFVGVLLGFDARLAKMLGDTNGGSYTYAESMEKIDKVFDTDFDFMMTPVAYDLSVSLSLAEGYELAELHGLPGTGDAKALSLDVPTVFFSRSKGAIVARLHKTEGAPGGGNIGSIAVAYRPSGTDKVVTDTVELAPAIAPGARKAVALVNVAEGLRTAVTSYHSGDKTKAIDTVNALIAHVSSEADALNDDGLRAELTMLRQLLANMGGDKQNIAG